MIQVSVMSKAESKTMENRSINYDPFEVLRSCDYPQPHDKRNIIGDAISVFQPDNPAPLFSLLHSADPLIVVDGLYVFSELGRRGRCVIDDVLSHLEHPDPSARYCIVEGMNSHYGTLSQEQLAKLLILCDDECAKVRFKIADFFSGVRTTRIEQAQDLMEGSRETIYHQRGLELMKSNMLAEHLLSIAIASHRITSCYCYAAQIALAKEGQYAEIEENYDGIPELKYLRSKIELIKKFPKLRNPPL